MNAFGMLSLLQSVMQVAPEKQNVGTTDRVISSAAGLLLGYTGIRNFKKGGFALLIPAGFLLYRGSSGYCPMYNIAGFSSAQGPEPFEFSKSLSIHRNKVEVYNFWRRLENLPLIMKHVKKVEKIAENKYRWEVEFNNKTFSWNAEITEDIPNEKISWTTLGSSDIKNSGTVEFTTARKNKGTELKVTMHYTPAHSKYGRMIGRFLDPVFTQMVKDDLKRFKHMMESEDYSYEIADSKVKQKAF